MTTELRRFRFSVLSSQAQFRLGATMQIGPVKLIFEELKRRRILVRYMFIPVTAMSAHQRRQRCRGGSPLP